MRGAGPEALRQLLGGQGNSFYIARKLSGRRQVDDERIAGGPPLRLEDRLHGLLIERIGCQPVNRFGRDGDQLAGGQQGDSFLYIGTNLRHRLSGGSFRD